MRGARFLIRGADSRPHTRTIEPVVFAMGAHDRKKRASCVTPASVESGRVPSRKARFTLGA